MKSIRQDKLEQAVLGAIQGQIKLVESLAAIVDKINEAPEVDNSSKRLEKMLTDKGRELQRIRSVYDSLYGDWKLGEISETEYRRMRDRYSGEMSQMEAAIENIKEELKSLGDGVTTENPLFKEFLQYRNITELNRSVLVSLIDVIYVYENNEITIKFQFEDELLRVMEFIEQNNGGRKTA